MQSATKAIVAAAAAAALQGCAGSGGGGDNGVNCGETFPESAVRCPASGLQVHSKSLIKSERMSAAVPGAGLRRTDTTLASWT